MTPNGFFHIDDYTDVHVAAADAEANGGGVILAAPPLREIGATIELGSRVVLRGCGKGSGFRLADNTATALNPVPMVRAKPNTNYVGVEDLTLDGNSANQSDTTCRSHGIDFTRSGTESSAAPLYDGGLWVRGVLVWDCQGIGVNATGPATTVRVTDTDVYHCSDAGFWGRSDSAWANLTAGNNGGYGWIITNATSVRGSNIKAFGNCWRYQGADLYVAYSSHLQLANIQAEDSRQHGMYLSAVAHATVVGYSAFRTQTDPHQDSYRSGLWVEDDGAGNRPHHVTIIGSVNGGGSAGTAYGLTTRNLGPGVLIDLGVEGMATGEWHHLSGSNGGRVILNGALQ